MANYGGNSVTELSLSGQVLNTFGGVQMGMNGPWGVAFDGAHIWVANQFKNSAEGFVFKL